MMRQNLPAQRGCVGVQIHLRGRDIFVPEHHLDSAQIGAAFVQMRGK